MSDQQPRAVLTPEEADFHFKAMVLGGMWALAKSIANPGRTGDYMHGFRSDALTWLDDQGRPGKEAAEYRREKIFAHIHGKGYGE